MPGVGEDLMSRAPIFWWSANWEKHLGKVCGRICKAERRQTLRPRHPAVSVTAIP